MADIKHVGRTIGNKRKCIVAYRVIPNDPEHCLVVFTESLEAADHDSLINLVQSNAGQNAYELGEAMARTTLSDGRNMLAAFHTFGKLTRIPTSSVEMIPNSNASVNLAELNKLIAEQKGVTVADLALQGNTKSTQKTETADQTEQVVEQTASAEPALLTDEDLAAQYRSQADALFKEAKRLREEAEALSPTKKKSAKTKESV